MLSPFSDLFLLSWVLDFPVPFLLFKANSLPVALILYISLKYGSGSLSLGILYIGLLVHVFFRLFWVKIHLTQFGSGLLLLKYPSHDMPPYLKDYKKEFLRCKEIPTRCF